MSKIKLVELLKVLIAALTAIAGYSLAYTYLFEVKPLRYLHSL